MAVSFMRSGSSFSEQNGMCPVILEHVFGTAAMLPANLQCPGYCRSRLQGLEPAFQIGKIVEVLALSAIGLDPAPAGHVGNGVVSGQIGPVGKPAVHHRIEPAALARIAFYGIVMPVMQVVAEMMRLTEGSQGTRSETLSTP